jgi:outer membrane protein assembly factor BamE (lipoprotein component of BamABCDE complex)
VFSPYRPDIQQGNFVSQEMLNQLKVGQTRDQVKFILGTPLLTDMFHADRWDYPFYLARGNGELTTSRVTVYLQGQRGRARRRRQPADRARIHRPHRRHLEVRSQDRSRIAGRAKRSAAKPGHAKGK